MVVRTVRESESRLHQNGCAKFESPSALKRSRIFPHSSFALYQSLAITKFDSNQSILARRNDMVYNTD